MSPRLTAIACSDGDKYDGEWRNDERHGKGAMIYCSKDSDVQEKYEGEWSEGRMHGRLESRHVHMSSIPTPHLLVIVSDCSLVNHC
jgi:hypothetical protein